MSPTAEPVRDPSAVQGGDTTHLPTGLITLDLSLCTNRLGPPPAAVRAAQRFLGEHADRLMPPPYEAPSPPFHAERRYLSAFADRLGIDERQTTAGRGVTEFLYVLGRLLRLSRVAVVTPEYTETMRQFAGADFAHPDDPVADSPELRLERTARAMKAHDFVILSNPSNPLGHYISRDELLAVVRANPQATLVVDEEYIAFTDRRQSLAGADVPNLVVLQSTGKTYGITATRAGMLWTRNDRLQQAVRRESLPWPLSLQDIVLATAALEDDTWIDPVLTQINNDARQLEQLLRDAFGTAVVPSEIHYRFVHLPDPYPALDHLHAHGIAARLFTTRDRDGTALPTDTARGRVPGLRLLAPSTQAEFKQLQDALATMPTAARTGRPIPPQPPYAGKWVLEPEPGGQATSR